MAGAFLERWFGFTERHTDLATEVRAGVTTFMVMAYIIFVNPIVLGYSGVAGLEGKGLPFSPTLTVTCLTAGLLSIAMGIASNYPFPLGLKRAISVGIGLFIAFIGFFTAGFVVKPDKSPLPVGLGRFDTLPAVVFVLGFVLTAWLMARRVRGALLIGILGSTALAIVLNGAVGGWQGFPTPGAATLPRALVQAPDFSTFGRLDFGAIARLGVVTAVLVTFSIMLRDFFETVGTIIGVGGKGGFLDAHGRLPRVDRVLLVDSLGAAAGGLANASSNTTYIESAAGVAEGGRTGLVPVVTGVLFLGAMWLSPLASVIPAQATAPALVIVGFYMMAVARDIPWDDYDEAIPAFVTMLVMPFTWSITNGIGAGFITYAAVKLLSGQGRRVHWMVYAASVAFVVYFALSLVERALGR